MMLSVKLRLTGFQNSFHDFQIELLEGHLYNNYSLTSDLLFYFQIYGSTPVAVFSAGAAASAGRTVSC